MLLNWGIFSESSSQLFLSNSNGRPFSATLCFQKKSKELILHKCSVTKLCPTLCNPVDCSPPGSSVLGISQARILEWIAISFSRVSSWLKDRICISCIAGGFFINWTSTEAQSRTCLCMSGLLIVTVDIKVPLTSISICSYVSLGINHICAKFLYISKSIHQSIIYMYKEPTERTTFYLSLSKVNIHGGGYIKV